MLYLNNTIKQLFTYLAIMEAIINIKGDIGDDITFMDVLTAVQEAKGASSYTFVVDSNGGFVDEGFRIARLIEGLDKPTKTIAKKVYSIANIIFFAGQERTAEMDADFMLHMAWFQPPAGNADDLRSWGEMLDKEDTRIREYITDKTGINDAILSEVMKQDTYVNAEQAGKLGFFNQVQQLRAVAKFTNNNMSKSEKEAKSLLEQIKSLVGIKAMDEEEVIEEETANPFAMEDGDYEMKDGKMLSVKDGLIVALSDAPANMEEEEEEKKIEELENALEETQTENASMLAEMRAIKAHLVSTGKAIQHTPTFSQAPQNANYKADEQDPRMKKAQELAEEMLKQKGLAV
jgi:ATP-dependent protease ClpP protease subunit